MRKIFSFMMTTLDGYHEGPNHEIDWHNVDEEFNQFAMQQTDEVDTLLFGRVTYELMAGYWPTPAARESDPEMAARMNSLPKIVVSRTLERVEWANTRLISHDVAGELTELKRQPGRDLAIFGSSNLTVSLLRIGLVDELRIMVNPIVLGSGQPLFQTADRTSLMLLKTRSFDSGNLLLYYQPAAS
jgi:dihydrofolate reductase